ncbi:hypothetical protein [Streptomyces sp. NPDC058718]|uniref:hypothetical protein n=1 Tax=Streptomyces sp. NPDC058718 TaxID=3346610 RepID=UPI0036B49498
MTKDEIAHIRTERPTPAPAALAVERGLGDWVDTLATKQGVAWRKSRASRLHFFTGGLIVSLQDGHVAAYDWGTVRVLQYRSTVNGAASEACSTLIAGAQLPATIAHIERGESLTFSPYSVDRQGDSDNKHAAAWTEITEIGSTMGAFMFNGHQRRSTAPKSAQAYRIPNPDLFVKPCRHLSPRVEG